MPTIDQVVNEANRVIHQAIEEGQADSRLIGMAIEVNQRYIEYLDQIQENIEPFDPSVTIQVSGTKIKFENDEKLAEWLSGRMDR